MKYRDFSGKGGFGVKNQLFPRKKMVLGRKTNFFLGPSFETLCGQTPKRWFFLVFPRIKMVWDRKTNFFRKKMVFGRKTNFFLGKTKKTKKKFFETLCGQTPKSFTQEKVGFPVQNHFFS